MASDENSSASTARSNDDGQEHTLTDGWNYEKEAVPGDIDGDGTILLQKFNPNDTTTVKYIPRHLFSVDYKVTREEAIDFNHHCKLGVKIGTRTNDPGEDEVKNLIKKVKHLFEGELKAMILHAIKSECSKRNLHYQGNPITNVEQLRKAWADDQSIQKDLWHCCFGLFAQDGEWELDYEEKAMKKLNFQYMEDDRTLREGTDKRGNKGCIAKLARKVKRGIMKNINRKAGGTHGRILVTGTAPVILGEYQRGKKRYKKRKTNAGFNFSESLHTKVCSTCTALYVFNSTIMIYFLNTFIYKYIITTGRKKT